MIGSSGGFGTPVVIALTMRLIPGEGSDPSPGISLCSSRKGIQAFISAQVQDHVRQ